jgi:hypothetical protein
VDQLAAAFEPEEDEAPLPAVEEDELSFDDDDDDGDEDDDEPFDEPVSAEALLFRLSVR